MWYNLQLKGVLASVTLTTAIATAKSNNWERKQTRRRRQRERHLKM